MYWCCKCYTIQPYHDKCYCCAEYLLEIEVAKNSGHFEVYCSLNNKYTFSAKKLILGREAQNTRFLFMENDYISREHAVLEVDRDKIIVSDLGSGNGTFFTVGKKDVPWQRIATKEKITIQSGDFLLLSKEYLCRVWSKWIPEGMTSEEKSVVKKGAESICLKSMAGKHGVSISFVLNKYQIKSYDKPFFVNGKKLMYSWLENGDKVIIDGYQYNCYRDILVPIDPVVIPNLLVLEVNIAKRLYIDELEFKAGKFICVVGKSGSGKSTLLKTLRGEFAQKQVVSKIHNAILRGKELQQKIAYVPQNSILYSNLTVEKSLLYSCLLQHFAKPLAGHLEKVKQILQQLELKKEQRIDQLSGGQCRRVNIAQELLRDTPIILLDEPTSGLDTQNHKNIMIILSTLCKQQRTVICTTHHLDHMYLADEIIKLNFGKVEDQYHPLQQCSGEFLKAKTDNRALFSSEIKPPKFVMCAARIKAQWNILLMRRLDEFFHPRSYSYFLSILLFVPFVIGCFIAIARPDINDDHRFFLYVIAAFWLGMSQGAQELIGKRYQIFTHEKANGVSCYSSLCAFIMFFGLVSLLQSIILTIPNFYIETTHMFLFFILTFLMGVSGSIFGLNLSLLESRCSLPISVTVPLFTIFQLLFSEMVMRIVDGSKYFDFTIQKTYDFFYIFSVSRYADLAFREYQGFPEAILPTVCYNIVTFVIVSLIVPSIILFLALKTAKSGKYA